jgi:hypothetical protein
MDHNIIRSIIFFVAGAVLVLFPEQVYRFHAYLSEKLHIKYDRTERKYSTYFGIVLIAISIVLLGVALS